MLNTKSLGLPEADLAIEAGLSAAQQQMQKMAFVVVDSAGDLIACARMDGAPARNLNHAIRKAFTAAVMGRNTSSFKRDLDDRGGDLAQWGDPRLTTLQGGLVAKADGLVVGAVACGGAPSHIDELTARAMIHAMGLDPVEDLRLSDEPQ